MTNSWNIVNLGEMLYPTPRRRKQNPKETVYQPGDIVIVVGENRAKGKVGRVVVERNGNYEDYEPYVNEESIGVSIVEKVPMNRDLAKVIGDLLNDKETKVETVVRWFDSPNELELLDKTGETK